MSAIPAKIHQFAKFLTGIKEKRLYHKGYLVVEQFVQLTVTLVETASLYKATIRCDRLSVRLKHD